MAFFVFAFKGQLVHLATVDRLNPGSMCGVRLVNLNFRAFFQLQWRRMWEWDGHASISKGGRFAERNRPLDGRPEPEPPESPRSWIYRLWFRTSELESRSQEPESEPVKYMNWDLRGLKISSIDPNFRGLKSGGLKMRLTWIGY